MELLSEENKIEKEVYDKLKTVIDSELCINIVDLGLIYKISYNKETGILVTMTLSSQGCPMGDVIVNQIEHVLTAKFPEIKNEIQIVWEPKWDTSFISIAGKQQLGM